MNFAMQMRNSRNSKTFCDCTIIQISQLLHHSSPSSRSCFPNSHFGDGAKRAFSSATKLCVSSTKRELQTFLPSSPKWTFVVNSFPSKLRLVVPYRKKGEKKISKAAKFKMDFSENDVHFPRWFWQIVQCKVPAHWIIVKISPLTAQFCEFFAHSRHCLVHSHPWKKNSTTTKRNFPHREENFPSLLFDTHQTMTRAKKKAGEILTLSHTISSHFPIDLLLFRLSVSFFQ